jgi:hypothetical protein
MAVTLWTSPQANTVMLAAYIVFSIVPIIGAHYMALRKGRSRRLWVALALFLTPISLLVLWALPKSATADPTIRPAVAEIVGLCATGIILFAIAAQIILEATVR